MDVTKLLFALIRAGLHEEPVDAKIAQHINADTLEQLYTLADSHDMAHILGVALAKSEKLGSDDYSRNFRAKAMLAVSRYERINYDLQTLCQALEDAQIPFIPLKGSVIRAYYPQPWMRTSCDIDILVHNEDLDVAAEVLQESLEYTLDRQGPYDLSCHSQSGTHVELHFDLIEEGWANSAYEILKDVWNCVTPKEHCKCHYVLPDDMFYFYHIAHMAKHFEQGGCGIRPFIDLWILEKMESADKEKRDNMLEKGKLLKFTQISRELVKVWFEGASYDTVTQRMQEYVFRGGVYGSLGNKIVAYQKRKGGKWKYIFSRIIPSYDAIKFVYPILQKHRWLTPVMQVHRWFKILFCGRTRKSIKELSYSQNISNVQMQQFKAFFEELGL